MRKVRASSWPRSGKGDEVIRIINADVFDGLRQLEDVSLELGRRAVLIELKADYCELIEQRTKTTYGLPL